MAERATGVTIPMEKSSLRLATDRETPPAPPRAVAKLTDIETAAVTTLVDGGEAALATFVRDRGAALAGNDGAGVRSRSISKALAIAETQASQIQLLLAQAIARRDVDAASMLDRMATGAVKRLAILCEQHRAEESKGHRPVVVVGQVNIGSGR